MMTIKDAINLTKAKFPFRDYITLAADAHVNIAKTVMRYLHQGDTLLDFGCGPCDKTAVLQLLGFKCYGYDDYQDAWHKIETHRKKILTFVKDLGINFISQIDAKSSPANETFDMIMLHDVLEHLHDSPRNLLNDLLEMVTPEGYLYITVPNAANIKKRIRVLCGKTNMERFDSYYWYPGQFRGHIREYVKDDLVQLCNFLNLTIIELHGVDHMVDKKLPKYIGIIYKAVTNIFPGWKDSWQLVAKKNRNWKPQKNISKDKLERITRCSPMRSNE
jgi:2-polyprenyl-3-methyl-5-hydroxy-6-metoxy-1,4-benzoquinol methylase